MSRWPMLMLRGSTYYYRRTVEKELRPLLGGKAQVWKSLRTSDLDTAKLRSLEEGQRVERQFQALRLRARSRAAEATAAQAHPDALARLYTSTALADDATWRSRRNVEDDEQLNIELDALNSAVQDHAAALRVQDVGIVATLLDDLLIEHGLTIPTTRRREFALTLLKARLHSLEVGVKRTRGEVAALRGESVVEPGITVDGLLDAYLSESKLGSKTEQEVRAAYRRFSAIVGAETPAREVTKADCRAYKASLLAAPSNRSLSKDGTLAVASVKRIMGFVATIFRFSVGRRLRDCLGSESDSLFLTGFGTNSYKGEQGRYSKWDGSGDSGSAHHARRRPMISTAATS